MIVTIDGPAGAGKSTVARAVAQRLGFRFLDTGAMYRAVALAGLRRGVDWDRPEQLAALAEGLDLRVAGDKIFLDGENVTEAIRSLEVTAVTRHAADNPSVRAHLVRLQRAIAGNDDIVAEGRDQGTIVFPFAQCKIFLTAREEERARRRLRDPPSAERTGHVRRGPRGPAAARPRGFHPRRRTLTPAPDAIELCTDGLTLDEAVARVEALVRKQRNF